MTKPLKEGGFAQGLYEISSTKRERLGTKRILQDGRIFRYAYAGGALVAGKLVQMKAINAHHENVAPSAAASAAATSIVMDTLSTTLSAGQLIDGYVVVQDDAGEGYIYDVTDHEATTTPTIKIEPGLQEALTTSSTLTLCHNPWWSCDHGTTEELLAVGVPLVDVTANYYCWLQTGGLCPVLINGSIAAGQAVAASAASSIEGAVGPAAPAVSTSVAAVTIPIVGYAIYAVNDTEYCPIYLTIDR